MKTILSAILGILLMASPVLAGPPVYGGPGDILVSVGASLPVFTDANSKLVTKSVADAVSALGLTHAVIYKGVIDASTSPNYPAGDAGDGWVISVAGKVGGASGKVVAAGDLILCNADSTATGDEAAVGTAWFAVQANIDLSNVTITGGDISNTSLRNKTKTISSTPVNLTEAELKGAIIYATTGAGVINLPAATATMDGAAFVVEAIAAVAVSIDPNGSEVLVVDGSPQAAGEKITFDGVAGTSVLIKRDATAGVWRVRVLSPVVINGGA